MALVVREPLGTAPKVDRVGAEVGDRTQAQVAQVALVERVEVVAVEEVAEQPWVAQVERVVMESATCTLGRRLTWQFNAWLW